MKEYIVSLTWGEKRKKEEEEKEEKKQEVWNNNVRVKESGDGGSKFEHSLGRRGLYCSGRPVPSGSLLCSSCSAARRPPCRDRRARAAWASARQAPDAAPQTERDDASTSEQKKLLEVKRQTERERERKKVGGFQMINFQMINFKKREYHYL